jgi:hypothetical protein
MQHLLGHGVTIGISSLLCALEHGRSEQQSAIPDSRCVSLFHGLAARKADLDLPVFGLTASPGSVEFVSFRCESPQINSSLARSLLRGFCDARRHGAVLLSGLLSQSESGPLLQNARLGAWESHPLA